MRIFDIIECMFILTKLSYQDVDALPYVYYVQCRSILVDNLKEKNTYNIYMHIGLISIPLYQSCLHIQYRHCIQFSFMLELFHLTAPIKLFLRLPGDISLLDFLYKQIYIGHT